MGFLHITASFTIVLCLFGAAPVLAQDSGSSSNGMETWKLIAIIVPSAVGGLTLISVFIFCCCCQRNGAYGGSGGLCGDCGAGCGNCGAGCGDCGAGCCGAGCCGEPQHTTNHRTVYSSSQGPVQVQEAYNYRSAPQPIGTGYYKEPTYVSNLPVNNGPNYGGGIYGGARAPVYGGGGRAPIYGSGGGCGC